MALELRPPRNSFPVLMYHGLTRAGETAPEATRKFWVETAVFETHLQLLAARGQAPAPLASALDGGPQGPVLSFDDGLASDYSQALPLLRRFGFSATFFVNPSRLGSPGYLRWSELAAMAQAGMAVESHGWHHVDLTRLPAAELRSQLRRSKAVIEERLGRKVEFLAAPFGFLNRRVVEEALGAGYRAVCSSSNHWARAGQQRVPRVAVHRDATQAALARLLEGGAWAYQRRLWRTRLLSAPGHALHAWRSTGEEAFAG